MQNPVLENKQNSSPERGGIDEIVDDVKDKLNMTESDIDFKDVNDRNLSELHLALKNKLDISQSEDNNSIIIKQDDINESELDLDKVPTTYLVKRYLEIRHQIQRENLTTSAQNKLLNLLAKIDEKLQSIEKSEFKQFFASEYEAYSHVLRKFYERLINNQQKELKTLQNQLQKAQNNLTKLQEELQTKEALAEESIQKKQKEFESLEAELSKLRDSIQEKNQKVEDLLTSMQKISEDQELNKNEKSTKEDELRAQIDELNKQNISTANAEIELKKLEAKLGFVQERYGSLKAQNDNLQEVKEKLTNILGQVSTNEIVESYDKAEKRLQARLEETEQALKDKDREIAEMQKEYSTEIERLKGLVQAWEEENKVLQRKEQDLLKEVEIKEGKLKKSEEEVKKIQNDIQERQRFIEEENERLRVQREKLEKEQMELDKLKAIEKDLINHKEQIRQLIEETNFKREQALKLINDVAIKGEQLENEKKNFEIEMREKKNSLKSVLEAKKKESNNKEYDSLPVCLGFSAGITVALTGCWLFLQKGSLISGFFG